MGRKATQLSATEVKAAKPKEKEYYLVDGSGLKLRIIPSGAKQWQLNYYRPTNGKRANFSLGKYPDLSLADARKLAQDARELIAKGIDPQDDKKQKKQEYIEIHQHTFFNVASSWFELKQHTVTADYAIDVWRSLELHIFPKLANTPIKEITAPEVIELLKPIEAKGSLETIKRLAQRLNEIMNYATNSGLIPANPLLGIKAVFKKPKKQNMLALAPNELAELMNAVAHASIKRTTRCLIEFQLHTMTRPSEASGARWDEIDFEAKVWTIPAERMKKRRLHRIPLTDQVLDLLEIMKPISGKRDFIFPADRDPMKACNSQTVNAALKRMGFAGRLVSHGLRSIASTTLNEQGFEPDLVEAALAHVDDNQVRSAYNRTDYLERRIPMMVWWSGHIEATATGSLSLTGMKHLKVI